MEEIKAEVYIRPQVNSSIMTGMSSTGTISSKARELLERIEYRPELLLTSNPLKEPSLGSSPDCSRPPLTLSTLQNIHKQWLLSVPFENISIHCGEVIELDIDKIYDKIVKRYRGGFCLEVNLLLNWLLRELGFQTTILGGEVEDKGTQKFPGPRNQHLIIQVDLDGKRYLADVGLGKHTPTTPLEMKLDVAQIVGNGMYRFVVNRQGTQSWFVEKILPEKSSIKVDGFKKAWSVMYRFSLKPCLVGDFLEACHYHQTNKESLFVCKSLATLLVPSGVRVYIGFVYKELAIDKNGTEQIVEQQNLKDSQIEDVLKEKFGIVVDDFVPHDDPIIFQ